MYYRISGSNSDLTIIDSDTTPLAGGNTSVAYEFLHVVSTASSNTPFYAAIPASMVRSYETSPQLTVTSNGMVGACPTPTACSVTWVSHTSEITSYTGVAPYTEITFVGADLIAEEIEYVSIGCVTRRCAIDPNTAVTTTGFKCIMNGDMIAGDHTMVVQSESGAIASAVGATNLDVDITISAIAPTNLFDSGGETVTITGNYFPKDLSEANTFSDFGVTIGGSTCVVQDVSQTQITCLSPRGLTGTPTVTVAFNLKTATSIDTFTINTSTYSVTSVNDTNICPVLKQDLEIVVSDTPSANADDYAGVLVNSNLYTIYMRVNAVNQGTNTLTVRFPGSPSNSDYTVYVEYNGERFASAVTIGVKSTITAIAITTTGSPAALSTTGGDTITITGTGFSTTMADNVVRFGNTNANVVSATETQLQVEAGSTTQNGTVDVSVLLKLSIGPTCEIEGGCTIDYNSALAPTLTSSSALNVVNGQVTITGTGFGTNPMAYIGTFMQTVEAGSTTTQVVVTLTKYNDNEAINLVVKTETVNLPTISLNLPITPMLSSVSPSVGSYGGQLVTLAVDGLSMAKDSNFNVYYGSGSSTMSICDSITLVDSVTLQCETMKDTNISSGTELKLSYTHVSSQSGSTTTQYLTCITA